MWKQDDKEFDKLSREAAENYPLDRQAGSWDKLLKRLDAELPEKERKRRWVPFLLLFLIVGGGIVYWGGKGGNGGKGGKELVVTKTNPNTAVTPVEIIAKDQANPNKVDEQIDQITETGISNKKSNFEIRNISAPGVYPERSRGAVKQNQQSQKSFEEIMNDQVEMADKKSDKKVVAENKNVTINAEPLTVNEGVKEVKGVKENLKKEEISATSAVKQKETKKKDNRWTFGLVYAPDLSSVKFTHTRPLGLNLGLTVDYKLNNRLSLQTGAIYTKKNYKLDGKDFNPPKGYWTYYYQMRDVTGTCNMWEIPLNLRFNAINNKSSKVFITTGLSSYLMQKEDYSFYYTSSGVPGTRDKTYTDNENYMFSILSISAGFEKQLSKKLSLQVEPFFKQPIKGIGFGNIKMNSSGVYLGLRYTPGGR